MSTSLSASTKVKEITITVVASPMGDSYRVRATTELLAMAAVMESVPEDESETITLVTLKRDYVYYITSRFARSVQETCTEASGELVC